ncbi:hypothetical protein [Ensifer aridi]|uniref:hypothetical protein n=1 Tax=Ensifer aridi TaxID=1708715 RepID=UPI0015E43452|nr:hypothetical protein [Ensifer aridi]
MQPRRYRFRQELDTGLPVVFGNEGAAIGYTKGEAEDVAYLMNVHDSLKRGLVLA